MSFWFLDGAPSFLDVGPDARYYAWSSYSKDGSVVAWDYAPNFGWLEPPECQELPTRLPSLPSEAPTYPPTGTDQGHVVGWPHTTENQPGVYSWDGDRCAGRSCTIGFMHNGYGSGDVEIRVAVVPGGANPDGATAVTIAGQDGIYRQIDALNEEWIVDIEGRTIAIRLTQEPGASQAGLADARSIIESMRFEPRPYGVGFSRLIFTLTNDEWDSG